MERPTESNHLLMDLDADDLAAVSFIDETLIVSILRSRYRRKKTYTFVGEILLSLNPFGQPQNCKRSALCKVDSQLTTLHPPLDIEVTAKRVYVSLLDSKISQCCLFSGESGSGKTEASKTFLLHLMQQCRGDVTLSQKIITFNPLLEAFGNACTSLNDNSSRFGKFIELSFNTSGKVIGATVHAYLLEKSRITHRNSGERNFHILHALREVLPAEHLKRLKLSSSARYHYIEEQGPARLNDCQESTNRFRGFMDGLLTIGFTVGEQESIFSILATILNMGNIKFSDRPEKGQPFRLDTQKFLRKAAFLLKVNRDSLCNQLQNLEIYSRGEVISRPYTTQEAEDCRDSIAKALYNRLFCWIIYRINQVLAPKGGMSTLTVGVLDIFGFEHLTTNGFEQLCINLANEQLHNFFNMKIFKQEQLEYESEGLSVQMNEIAYHDNEDLMNMFLERPIGILSLIDEECHFPQGTDATLITKFSRNFAHRGRRFQSTFYPVPGRTMTEPTFTISHFAGEVVYNAKGFLEKNRDSLPDRVVVLLQSSLEPVVNSLFTASLTRSGSLTFNWTPDQTNNCQSSRARDSTQETGTAAPFSRSTRKRLTLGYQFRTSLAALLEKMNRSETHYVRCIKSNREQKAGKFDSSYVLTQLRNAGVLETVWIRRHGFSYRPTFAEFASRFGGLFNQAPDGLMTLIDSVLAPYGSESWCLGKTKIFIKYSTASDLGERIRLRDVAAARLQKWYRCKLQRRRSQELVNHHRKVASKSKINMVDDTDTDNQRSSTPASQTDDYSHADSYEVCQWFKDCVYDQLNPSRLVERQITQPKWFFENLSRQDAEVLLRNQSVGCFLVRASSTDSDVLVLSFRAMGRGCKHYLIDRLTGNKLIVRGEARTHDDLASLLDYYRRFPLSNYTGCLTHFYGYQPPNRVKSHPAEYDQLPPNITRSTRRSTAAPKGLHVC